MKAIGIKLFVIFIMSFSFLAADTIKDSATGQTFPDEVSFTFDGTDYDLEATGVSTRKKFFIKVYSIASYLQKGATNGNDKFQEIMQPGKAKQLTLKWLRDVDRKRIQDGYLESLKKASDSSQFQDQINQFVAFFSDGVKNGDEHAIRWIPGGVIEVLINGSQVGTIKSEPFARSLWGIWFGPGSVVNRDNLTSMMQ